MFKKGDYVLTEKPFKYYDENLNEFKVFNAGFLKQYKTDYFGKNSEKVGFRIRSGLYTLCHENYFGEITKENSTAFSQGSSLVPFGYVGTIYADSEGNYYNTEQMKEKHPTVLCGAMRQLARGIDKVIFGRPQKKDSDEIMRMLSEFNQ